MNRRQVLRWSLGLGALAGVPTWLAGTGPAAASSAPRVPLSRIAAGAPLVAAGSDELVDLAWVKLNARTLDRWTLARAADGLRLSLTPKNALAGEAKRILILFTKPLNTFDATLTKILDVLADKQVPVTITLLNYEQDTVRLRAAIRAAESDRVDLLAPMGSETTEDVRAMYEGGALPVLSLFTKDPVLQGWVPNYDQGSGSNLAYCSVAVPIEVQLAYLRELKPDVQNVAVLYSTSSRSTIEAQVEPLRRLAEPNGLTMFDIAVTDDRRPETEFEAGMPAALAKMAARDPSLQRSVFWATGTTAVINSIGTISRLAGSTPVVAVYPDLVQEGEASAVVSVGIAYENVGYLDSVYLLDLLYNGKRAGDLKVGVISPPDLAISFRKARDIGLKIPFGFFENAGYVYDPHGRTVRKNGQVVSL